MKSVKSAGLLRRRHGYYGVLALVLTVVLGMTVTGMIFLGSSWWSVALAPPLAIVLTQFAFLAHELAHKAVFASGNSNDIWGRIIANLVVGISYSWWMNKHSDTTPTRTQSAKTLTLNLMSSCSKKTLPLPPPDCSAQLSNVKGGSFSLY